MKKYTIEVIIHEGNDEFWESLEGKTGADEVLEVTKECLEGIWHDFDIKLVKYTDEE